MSENNGVSTADVAEGHVRRGMLALLVMSLQFVSVAASRVAGSGSEVRSYLVYLAVGLTLLAMALLASGIFGVLREIPRADRAWYFRSGFVAHAMNRARWASLLATVTLLIGLYIFTELTNYSGDLPIQFFLEVVLAVSLAVLGSVFIYQDRADREHDLGDAPGA